MNNEFLFCDTEVYRCDRHVLYVSYTINVQRNVIDMENYLSLNIDAFVLKPWLLNERKLGNESLKAEGLYTRLYFAAL
jgi:hypothetical protein